MPSDPVRFVFGVHLHQPVGNFDHVFEEHVDGVYQPFLRAVAEGGLVPLTVHVSGPLLEWMEARAHPLLDLLGRLVADGWVELLASGLYEPILAAIGRADRAEQIGWMRERLARRFGVEAHGLWLTERVWEPSLTADLADAGIRYALVDDRHFLVSGFEADELHTPYVTEHDGRRIALLPIDERLRYLIPFRAPMHTRRYLRELSDSGHGLAVLGDDGEKFGGWPGTHRWIYRRGWLERFLRMMNGLVERGSVRLVTGSDAVAQVESGGIAYLPTASYREMESWALPTRAAVRLLSLEEELGEDRMAGPEGSLLRGGHWPQFLAKYPEANRMHKKMSALSALCRMRGDPPEVRRAVARAQCNDAYWHGVFGGLYLPHLRQAVWRELAAAERALRAGEGLTWEVLDFDADGRDEIWVHSSEFSAVISPARGGAVEEYTLFSLERNYADTLTRRLEAYHHQRRRRRAAKHERGAPSIHRREPTRLARRLPGLDPDPRALFVDRALPGPLTLAAYRHGDFEPVVSWANRSLGHEVRAIRDPGQHDSVRRGSGRRAREGVPPSAVEVTLAGHGLEKVLRFAADGRLTVRYRWEPESLPDDAWFAPEISLAHEAELRFEPHPRVWRFAIETLGRSERGLEKVVQGSSVTPRWRAELGEARVELLPVSGDPPTDPASGTRGRRGE